MTVADTGFFSHSLCEWPLNDEIVSFWEDLASRTPPESGFRTSENDHLERIPDVFKDSPAGMTRVFSPPCQGGARGGWDK